MRGRYLSFPKILVIGSIAIFSLITMAAIYKKKNKTDENAYMIHSQSSYEVNLANSNADKKEKEDLKVEKEKKDPISENKEMKNKLLENALVKEEQLPEKDIVDLLFVTDSSKLPLVETVVYSSRVPWLSDRPAWVADYASHYETTRHFIARSLNKKIDYFTQKVTPGDRFNVLKKNISFHLLIDLTRAKMWFYGLDHEANKRYLLKTYKVGLGRKDSKKYQAS